MPRMRDVISGKARLASRRRRVKHNTQLTLWRSKLRGKDKKETVKRTIAEKSKRKYGG
jgi:hypothetical protein